MQSTSAIPQHTDGAQTHPIGQSRLSSADKSTEPESSPGPVPAQETSGMSQPGVCWASVTSWRTQGWGWQWAPESTTELRPGALCIPCPTAVSLWCSSAWSAPKQPHTTLLFPADNEGSHSPTTFVGTASCSQSACCPHCSTPPGTGAASSRALAVPWGRARRQ